MSPAPDFRKELDVFVASGWFHYVLESDGWWIDGLGKLKPTRRNSIAEAFLLTRERLQTQLNASRRLYRTLLLSRGYDTSSFYTGPKELGVFWTSCRECAWDYIPRRCYQKIYPMPDVGVPHVLTIDDVRDEEVDWNATVGCHLTNPGLQEFRLKPGTLRMPVSVAPVEDDDGLKIVKSSAPVPGITPIPEGPGFIANFRALNAAGLSKHVVGNLFDANF